MKQLTCEMCGSTDLMKQDGVFVCQSCGTKYSVEEAKRMMIEGTVDVSGSTVKVDTTSELANLYQIARRARDDNNTQSAERYYDMILMKDPTSWEATFYVVYSRAKNSKIMDIQSAAISVANCEDTVLKLIRDHVPADKQAAAVKAVIARSIDIARLLAIAAKKHWDDTDASIRSKYVDELTGRLNAAFKILEVCGDQVERIWCYKDKTIAALAAHAWKALISMQEQLIPASDSRKKAIYALAHKIEKYDQPFSKKYLTAEKREQLESEISGLKVRIREAKTPPSDWRARIIIDLVLFTILFTAMLIDYSFILLLGAGFFAFMALGNANALGNAKKKYGSENTAVLEEELKKKEAELEALKK